MRNGAPYRKAGWLLAALLFCPLAGGDEPAAVATVDGQPITAEAFRTEMARRGLVGSRAGLKQKEALLDEMIRLEVLAARGREAGYDKDPEIVAALKRMLAEKFERDRAGGARTASVSDAEIAQYYADHPAEFGAVERRRAALIFMRISAAAAEGQKQDAAERAARAAGEAKKQDPSILSFGKVAAKYSEDQATRYVGGDVGWLRMGESSRFDPAVVAALFKLSRPGDVSPVVAAPDGLYVVKLTERDGGVPRPLAAVRANIARQLAQEKKLRAEREAYEKVRAGAHVSVDRAVLDSIQAPVDARRDDEDDTPPPLPPGP